MTALATAEPDTGRLFDPVVAEPTLDQVLTRVWEGLGADRVVKCPVCGGKMAPEYGANAQRTGGRCSDCAATLR